MISLSRFHFFFHNQSRADYTGFLLFFCVVTEHFGSGRIIAIIVMCFWWKSLNPKRYNLRIHLNVCTLQCVKWSLPKSTTTAILVFSSHWVSYSMWDSFEHLLYASEVEQAEKESSFQSPEHSSPTLIVNRPDWKNTPTWYLINFSRSTKKIDALRDID